MYVLLSHIWVTPDGFLYKTQTKQICHIIASKVTNHMTWISTNNKCLNWVFPWNLTDYKIYLSSRLDAMTTSAQKILSTSSPAPNTFPQLLIGCQDAEAPFSTLSLAIKMHGSL